MRVVDLSAHDGNGRLWIVFQVSILTELAGGHVRLTQTERLGWRFELSGLYFASEMELGIEALELARNLAQAIDANPENYKAVLEQVQAVLEGNH